VVEAVQQIFGLTSQGGGLTSSRREPVPRKEALLQKDASDSADDAREPVRPLEAQRH
jgi:hypothetical protein